MQQATSTTVGETIIISGKLQGDEDLTVQGRIEGSISLTKDLFIESTGIVKADVNVRNIHISGVLVGNIVASEKVEVAVDGRMVGDINAPRVLIYDGAHFKGQIDMGNLETPRQAGKKGALPAPSRAAAGKPTPAKAGGAPPKPPTAGKKTVIVKKKK